MQFYFIHTSQPHLWINKLVIKTTRLTALILKPRLFSPLRNLSAPEIKKSRNTRSTKRKNPKHTRRNKTNEKSSPAIGLDGLSDDNLTQQISAANVMEQVTGDVVYTDFAIGNTSHLVRLSTRNVCVCVWVNAAPTPSFIRRRSN